MSINENKNISNDDLIKFIKRYKKYPIGFWYIKYNSDINKFSVYHIDDPKNSHYDDESGQKCIKFINKEINKSHSKNPFDLSETNENSINASSYLLLTRLQNLDSILSDNKEWIKSVSEALKTCSVNNLEDLSKQYIVTAMKLKDKGEKLTKSSTLFLTVESFKESLINVSKSDNEIKVEKITKSSIKSKKHPFTFTLDDAYRKGDIVVQRIGGSAMWNVGINGEPKGRVNAATKEFAIKKAEKLLESVIIEAKNNKLWYIGRRDNPQLSKPYYKAYGQLPKSDVKKKEDCAYGSMTLTSYETEEAYNKALDKLKEDGFSVR